MENSQKSKGLKRLFAATVVVALAYIGCMVLFAYLALSSNDADIAGVSTFMMYYLNGIKDLLVFNFANNSNVAYFALSVFLYALIACWVLFLIVAVVVSKKKRRKVLLAAVVLIFINIIVYMFYAAGSKKYWQIINAQAPYENNKTMMILALMVIVFGSLHFVVSIVSYFWALFESYLNPGEKKKPAKKEVKKEQPKPEYPDDELIRKVIREELINNQPFAIYVTNEQIAVMEEAAAPVVVEEPVQEEEPQPEPEPEQEPIVEEEAEPEVLDIPLAEEPIEEAAPVLEEVPQETTEEEANWNRSVRQPFINRIITADADIKANYNEIKNEILSYGVKSRLSRGGETFRLHEKRYVKIYLVGKTLKVYFALSPEDYKDSTIPVEDVGHRPNYADMPLLFKVRSGLSVRRCKELVKAACEKDGLTQGEVQDVNWINDLRKINAEKAKGKKGE